MNTSEKPKNLGGRPREHDREDIAQKLLEWSTIDENINLCKFSADYLITPTKVMDWARECPKFRAAYELAKSFLGFKREKMLSAGTLHIKAYDLNASNYDLYLKADKMEHLEYENKLKKDIIKFMFDLKNEADDCLTDELRSQFNSLMTQITASQNKPKK